MARRGNDATTVYSSEHGRHCAHCGLPQKKCVCRANPRGDRSIANAEGDGVVRVGRTSKGKGGKTITQVTGVQLPANELLDLAKALKKRCATGGALKNGVIEIQGDQRDTLVAELEKRGFTVKRTGG